MGSLEEEELVQMVQDFIESESPLPISSTSTTVLSLNHQSQYLTLQAILGGVTDSEMFVLEKVLKYLRSVRFHRKTDSLNKWLVMRLRTDGYNASLCKTSCSWITTLNCPGGGYEYIDTMVVENGDSIRLIIDIDFKSQFELARPTPVYTNLLNSLPSTFVGSEAKLVKIISLLCSAAKLSLKERGLHIPPWRKISYMQSKWLSHCQKVSTTSVTSSKEIGRENTESSKFGKWTPPKNKPKRRGFGGESALTSQFSQKSINCC